MRHRPLATDSASVEDARRVARTFATDFGLEAKVATYESHRWPIEEFRFPVLHLDDVSGIPFVKDVAGVEEYQHRGRLRARDHDIYVTVTPAVEGYEDYCRETLGLGAPEHLIADPVAEPAAVAKACAHGKTRARLAELARLAGGMAIHPYMGIEEVWELASVLATDAGCEVRVLSPPPPVTWIANDKAVFDELVVRVLGRDALIETRISKTEIDIATDLRAMAARHDRVGLKRTRTASAMGNAVFDAADVRTLDSARDATLAFLHRTEWPTGEDVLTVAWLDTDLSPSTQVWIPPLGHGDPQLDGIYEQILTGKEKVFVGSRPSSLPNLVERVLARNALLMATAFQELGYVGRCSFDHVVTGDPLGDFEALFTECNGRWGGTSTPMSLLDRLLQGPRPPYRAQDVVFPTLAGARFVDIVELTRDRLFTTGGRQDGFLFYNLGPLREHGKFDVISIAGHQQEAESELLETLPALLGA